MKAMEKTVSALEERLFDKQHSLEASEKAREDLALGLSEVRREVQRATQALERSQRDLREAVTSRKIALNELDTLTRINKQVCSCCVFRTHSSPFIP